MKLFISTFIISSLLYSQSEVTVDTLLTNQEKMLINQQKILSEVVYVNPLLNMKYGIEFNPAYFLISSASNEGFVLSGSFSLFSISEKAEIAFPIYFSKGEDDLKILHIDSHYRFFTGIHRNGFYFSAGLRYTFLEGREGGDFFGFTWEESEEIINISKIGLTFGIGYRRYGNNGWYWATSLFGGRYFTDKELSIIGAGAADGNAIIDIELLKIGKMF